MAKGHHYSLTMEWTGNIGEGTRDYKSYDRSYQIKSEFKPDIAGSSDPAFRGDKTKYNPEELLLASLSSCHMLWFLHLCSESDIIVLEYRDQPSGVMTEDLQGGKFSKVTLNPIVKVKLASMIDKAKHLHNKAHELCYIANSVNFPVLHHAKIFSAD